MDKYFTGTASRIEGVGLDVLAREAAMKHEHGVPAAHRCPIRNCRWAAAITYRVRGEYHLLNPLDHQQAAACGAAGKLRDLPGIHRPDRQAEPAAVHAARPVRSSSSRAPVPLEEVEPASEIVKRFATGAMSFGSISQGGARDAGHRHEPHRRQVQYRRGRRRRSALQARRATAICGAAPSSRWLRRASA